MGCPLGSGLNSYRIALCLARGLCAKPRSRLPLNQSMLMNATLLLDEG
jgi:hypothetical protein